MLTIVALAAAAWPTSALADGDPASDVLVGSPLFLPPDAALTLYQQSQLGALLQAAAKSGYPLRVAVIASPADLGSVTPLWRQPQAYAGFLGEELSLLYKGTLLVVMPDGFGLYGPGAAVPAQRAALSERPTGGLGAGTIAAVERLSAAAGHPLSVGPIETRSVPSTTDYVALIALAIGAALIAAAWTASLRTRPLRFRRAPAA
ncbi:MAG: hypothetical protein ACLPV4_13015 [Solirubrobacteraceae bacterium]